MADKAFKHILLAIICALSICCAATAASTYPMQASVQVIKPSVYLEDYGDGFDERVRTKSHAVFSPITLYHGTPDRLGAAELAPYFDVRNLDITGSLVNGAMPEGVAQFSVEVLEYYTGVPLSLPASTVRLFLKRLKIHNPIRLCWGDLTRIYLKFHTIGWLEMNTVFMNLTIGIQCILL